MTGENGKPLDQSPGAVAGAALFVSLYGVAALALIGMSGYFAFVEKLPITEPKVFVGLLGAGYLALRAFMIFNKRSQKKGGHAR